MGELFLSMFGFVIILVGLLIAGIGTFLMARKAGYDKAWLAFIPFLIWIPFFRIINKSLWNIILLFIPIVNIIMGIIWLVELLQVFDRNVLMVLLILFIPGFLFFYEIYLGLSPNVKYVG